VYDPETDAWTRKSALPQEVSGPRYSCVIDYKIYIIKDSTGDDVYKPTVGEGRMHIYDTITDAWSTGATLPTFYKHSRLVATTGEHAPKQIYLVGGMIVLDGFAQYEGVNASFRYDPAADSWSRAADMHTARYEAAVAVVADKIYAIGGATKLPAGPEAAFFEASQTGAVEVYTPFGYGTIQPTETDMPPQPDQSLPTAAIAVASAALAVAVGAGLIVYFKKHRRQTKPSHTKLMLAD